MAQARILLVDDDDLNIEVMQAYLETEGYLVDAVYSGERALEQVKQSPPDVILLDVRMSGIDGYETCRILKEDNTTKHIPILMITGFNDDQDINRAIEAGIDDILFKPIKSALMLLRVRRLAYQKHLYDQLHA